MQGDLSDFISHMKTPREQIDAPPPSFGDAEPEASNLANQEVLEEVEEGTLSYFDFDEEHEKTAEFGLVLLDQLMSFIAGLYSGQDASKYERFQGGKKKPSKYQIEVTAAMVKKYQAKMQLEWMFATAIFMAYAPIFSQAHKDRSQAKKAKAIKEDAERIAALRDQINK